VPKLPNPCLLLLAEVGLKSVISWFGLVLRRKKKTKPIKIDWSGRRRKILQSSNQSNLMNNGFWFEYGC